MEMVNNGDSEASICQKSMELSGRLFNNLFPVFFRAGLGGLSDIKSDLLQVFKNRALSGC